MGRRRTGIKIRISGKPKKVLKSRGGGLLSMFSRKKKTPQNQAWTYNPTPAAWVKSIKPKLHLRLSSKPKWGYSNIAKIKSPKIKVRQRKGLRTIRRNPTDFMSRYQSRVTAHDTTAAERKKGIWLKTNPLTGEYESEEKGFNVHYGKSPRTKPKGSTSLQGSKKYNPLWYQY